MGRGRRNNCSGGHVKYVWSWFPSEDETSWLRVANRTASGREFRVSNAIAFGSTRSSALLLAVQQAQTGGASLEQLCP